MSDKTITIFNSNTGFSVLLVNSHKNTDFLFFNIVRFENMTFV